ncbi:MAG TPA: choice-of-anchor L domain-containing protein, partial [Polyangiaceae bacterium]
MRGGALASLLALSAALSAGACGGGSSNGGSGGGGGDDSGQGGDTTGSSGSSSGSASSSGSSSGASSGGIDASSSSSGSGSGGSGGSDASGDATFAFDGFSHPDGWSDASYCPDDDGDGWTVCGGDCNDHDSTINPCAFDTNDATDPVGHDGIDNDCDGKVDNLITCEPTAAAGTFDTNPVDYANASDLCDNPMCPRLVNSKAIWYGPSPGNARRVTKHEGAGQFNPHQGQMMSFLSSGTAVDSTDQASYSTCPGTDFSTTFTNPMPLTAAQNTNPCGTGVDESTVSVHDYTELRMTVRAPINAGSFTFDFAFFSEEYPVYICQGFNDTFLALQYSQQFPMGEQIAFDANGHRINV